MSKPFLYSAGHLRDQVSIIGWSGRWGRGKDNMELQRSSRLKSFITIWTIYYCLSSIEVSYLYFMKNTGNITNTQNWVLMWNSYKQRYCYHLWIKCDCVENDEKVKQAKRQHGITKIQKVKIIHCYQNYLLLLKLMYRYKYRKCERELISFAIDD